MENEKAYKASRLYYCPSLFGMLQQNTTLINNKNLFLTGLEAGGWRSGRQHGQGRDLYFSSHPHMAKGPGSSVGCLL